MSSDQWVGPTSLSWGSITPPGNCNEDIVWCWGLELSHEAQSVTSPMSWACRAKWIQLRRWTHQLQKPGYSSHICTFAQQKVILAKVWALILATSSLQHTFFFLLHSFVWRTACLCQSSLGRREILSWLVLMQLLCTNAGTCASRSDFSDDYFVQAQALTDLHMWKQIK